MLMFHVALEHRNCYKETSLRLFNVHVREYSSSKVLFIIFYKLWFISFGVSGLFLSLEVNLFWLVLKVFLEDKLDIPGQK